MFIEVEDENDHIPLTLEPIYWASVAENSGPKTPVIRIDAVDGDHNGRQTLRFQLKAGNPQSLFDIDPKTGQISISNIIQLEISVTNYGSSSINWYIDLFLVPRMIK